MDKEEIDYFKYVDNFAKISSIDSILINGEPNDIKPDFSILIPTYKRSEILKDTIKSALDQTYVGTYEIIVIDNDPERNCETEKLIHSFDSKKILYYKNVQNLGMFGNWNRGVELTNSNWITLIHDDDYISPFFLEYCCNYLKDNSIAIIKPLNVNFSTTIPTFTRPKKRQLRKLKLEDFYFSCAIGAPTNIILNKDITISLGGFDQDYFPTSDYVFSAKCSYFHKVYEVPVVLGGYRISASESLKEETMIKYYTNRFHISSFIMNRLGVPKKLILNIQSVLIPDVVKTTNKFYSVDYKFDHLKAFHLKMPSKFYASFLKIANKLFYYVLQIRKRLYLN